MWFVQISQILVRLFETFLLNVGDLAASKYEELILIDEATAVRDLLWRVSASYDLLPLRVLDIVADRL